MWYSLLSLRTPDVSTEAKYLIIALTKKYGIESKIDGTVSKLVKELGVTDRIVTKCVQELVLNGYLSKQKLYRKGARHGFMYEILPKVEDGLDFGNVENELRPQRRLVADLFEDVSRPRRHPLKTANRLLLAILMRYADACGVVRDLSLTDLSALTCMSRDRLVSQLSRLKEYEYVRSSVSGVASFKLLGAVSSVYFLNMRHMHYTERKLDGLTVLCRFTSQHRALFNESRLIRKLSEELERARSQEKRGHSLWTLHRPMKGVEECIEHYHQRVPIGRSAEKWIECADELIHQQVQSYFQYKVEEYASYLLTHQWSWLEESDFGSVQDTRSRSQCCDDVLKDRIQKELLVSELIYWSSNKQLSYEQKQEFFCAIYLVVFDLAKHVQQLLLSCIELNFSKACFVILPRPRRGLDIVEVALECFVDGSDCCQAALVGIDVFRGEVRRIVNANEENLRPKERWRFGLISDVALKKLSASSDFDTTRSLFNCSEAAST